MKNQIQKINNPLLFEMESKLDLIVKGQESNSNKLEVIGNDLRKGFIGLALRNEELLKSNDQLKQQLDEVLNELNAVKKKTRRENCTERKMGQAKTLTQTRPD